MFRCYRPCPERHDELLEGARGDDGSQIPEQRHRYGHLVKLVLPELGERGVVVNVFETPGNNGLIVSTDRLIADLKREREKYP